MRKQSKNVSRKIYWEHTFEEYGIFSSASAGFLFALHFDAEDGGDMFLRRKWTASYLHGVRKQKTALNMVTKMETPNPICKGICYISARYFIQSHVAQSHLYTINLHISLKFVWFVRLYLNTHTDRIFVLYLRFRHILSTSMFTHTQTSNLSTLK